MCLSIHWWFPVFPQNKERPVQHLAVVRLLGCKNLRAPNTGLQEKSGKNASQRVYTSDNYLKTLYPHPTYLSILG